jgi:hypothetical protein
MNKISNNKSWNNKINLIYFLYFLAQKLKAETTHVSILNLMDQKIV